MSEKKSEGETVTPKLDEEGNPMLDDNGDPIMEEVIKEDPKPPSDSDDPLDAIEDEDERAEAKKHRAIARRVAKGEKLDSEGNLIEEKKKEEVGDEKPAATKNDLMVMQRNAAKKLVPQEVSDVWDELMDIPLGGADELDADSIATNFIKRYNVYRMDNPIDPDNPAAPLSTSPTVPKSGQGGKKNDSKKDEKGLPGYKEPTQPEEWYPKEE